MQAKLKEMMLVIRPTDHGRGIIRNKELEQILLSLGYDFLTERTEEIIKELDPDQSGHFNQDELIEYIYTNHS